LREWSTDRLAEVEKEFFEITSCILKIIEIMPVDSFLLLKFIPYISYNIVFQD
jgi:hypothetical protein